MSIDNPNWTLVCELSLSQNIDELIRQLNSRNINYRVVVDEQRQSIWVEGSEYIVEVDQLVRALQQKPEMSTQDPWSNAAPIEYSQRKTAKEHSYSRQALYLFRHFPVVMWGITFSVLGMLLITMKVNVVHTLTFPYLNEWSLQTCWRWLTPIFLHFGLSHIIFNSLWLWVFGSRLEQVCGSRQLLFLVLFTGLAGNFAQYIWSQTTNFGGMSGVVYGLMGYIWVKQMYNSHPLLVFPPMLFGVMLFFLLLGVIGILSRLTGSGIANAAHLGGLLAGAAMAYLQRNKAQRPRR